MYFFSLNEATNILRAVYTKPLDAQSRTHTDTNNQTHLLRVCEIKRVKNYMVLKSQCVLYCFSSASNCTFRGWNWSMCASLKLFKPQKNYYKRTIYLNQDFCKWFCVQCMCVWVYVIAEKTFINSTQASIDWAKKEDWW